MHWLSRKDSRNAGPQGAIVVRTPEDALRETHVRVTYPPPPASPPLPPLPGPAEEEAALLDETPKRPPRPHHAAPPPPSPTPSSSSLRPSLRSRSSTAVEDAPHVPAVPSHIPLSGAVPPFRAMLISPSPAADIDPSQTIVTLETCSSTFKSTLATLSSRPSLLADYLAALTKQPSGSHTSSVYSAHSPDVQAYRTLHVFLDRPSAPYPHILTFLRTPSISAEYPSTLPRAVQLSSLTNSTSSALFNAKLEALLELRDEAAYLGLDSLHRLCTDEIRQRLAHATRHTRGPSHASVNTMMGPGLLPSIAGGPPSAHSHHASVYSLHTLIERVDGDSSAKDPLTRISTSSESLDEEDTGPLPSLSFPTSPLPLPFPMPTSPPPTATAAPAPLPTSTTICPSAPPPRPPRHYKDIPQAPSRPSPSHSASSSPGQTFSRPQLHKKSESMAAIPLRPFEGGRRPGNKVASRIAAHHTPSPSVGTGSAPPGWI